MRDLGVAIPKKKHSDALVVNMVEIQNSCALQKVSNLCLRTQIYERQSGMIGLMSRCRFRFITVIKTVFRLD